MQRSKLKIEIKSLILLINVFPLLISAQLSHDFEQGDLSSWFSNMPDSWDTSSVFPLSGHYSLRHTRDNTQTGMDAICLGIDSLRPDLGSCRWAFSLRHGYAPSAVNRWMVFLVSDMGPASAGQSTVEGIAVEVNYGEKDDIIRLISVCEDSVHTIINTGVNWEQSIGTLAAACFTITRETGGNWTLWMGRMGDAPGSLCQLSGHYQWLPDIRTFGIWYHYSSGQDRKLWFDDLLIDGVFERDTTAPAIAFLNLRNGKELVIGFTERINEHCLQQDSITLLEQAAHPDSMNLYNGDVLYLRFQAGFSDEAMNTLAISGVRDNHGNSAGLLEWQFFYYRPKYEDLVINEIMADPEPSSGLPEFEYVELFNACPYELNTAGWVFSAGQREWELDPACLAPKEYVLIIHAAAKDLYGQVRAMPLFTSATSLNNESGRLRILDGEGGLVSEVDYYSGWHTDGFRGQGGWSLERIDPGRPCGGSENWTSCLAPRGGTPGSENSVYAVNPDRKGPGIQNIYCPDSLGVDIQFTELMDRVSLLNREAYSVNHGFGHPDSVAHVALMYDRARLFFSCLFRHGEVYRLDIRDGMLMDCSGNILQATGDCRFGLPGLPGYDDILISEILFNPLPGCVDYVELYNNSRDMFDLSDLRVSLRDAGNLQLTGNWPVAGESRLLFPGEYVVLSENPDILADYYYVKDPSACYRTPDLPPLGDREGHLVLLNRQGSLVDEVHYREEMHFSLLDSREGIALERVSFSPAAEASACWHSASETSGFGTPGYENSQMLPATGAAGRIRIHPRFFSPDNDGYQDILSISYSFERPGNIINVLVFDPRGRLVCRLADNQLAGTEGIITWNGINDGGALARTGMYLVFIEYYDLLGRKTRIRDFCILR